MRTITPKPRRTRRDAQLSEMGDTYLALIDANHRRPVTETFRAEREAHQASRPCRFCEHLLVDGACPEHGAPADDAGVWLWA